MCRKKEREEEGKAKIKFLYRFLQAKDGLGPNGLDLLMIQAKILAKRTVDRVSTNFQHIYEI